jgi:polygalacturonase
MKSRLLFFLPLFSLASSALAAAPGGTFNVLDYGAVPDGQTKATAAIARAVAACAAAGGGTVEFPAGRYLTGSIQLESNLTLNLEAGATLLYSGDPADSPLVPSRWEDTTAFTHAPLIYANGKENIAIVGRGTLDGQGANWWWRSSHTSARSASVRPAQAAWQKIYDRTQAGEKFTAADFTLAAEYLRPSLVQPYHCKNVLIEGVTLTESPMWMLHPLYSENVEVRGVTFRSDGPNTDGIDIDSCRDVRISDCFFATGDDCIVIKSGRDADGRRVARPTEHVTITNCVMYQGHGAIVIGSESSGDIRDIAASNIVAKGTDRGIRIKSQRGRGGVIENVRCDNFVIEDALTEAIEITTLYTHVPPEPLSERTPVFRNLSFSNLTIIHAHQVASIAGLPEKAIEGLRFSDITATGQLGFLCDHANDIELHDVRVSNTSGSAFVFDTVRRLVLDDVTSATPLATAPVIRLANADAIWLRGSQAAAGTGTFLRVDGPKPAALRLTDNDLSAAAIPQAPAGL